nr:COMM domain-containing protein 7-like [Procambarus clarkii]
MVSVGSGELSHTWRNELLTLSRLSNDDFLAAWDSSLKLLGEKRKQERKYQPYYIVNKTKDEVELHAEKLCQVLESLVQRPVSDEDLRSLLTSSGLREDRINLFVSQRDQLQELVSSRKLLNNPRGQLVDLQWKFGVVAGSSSEGEAGRTFVQVKLVSRAPDGRLTPRHVEMSVQKFYDFLHQLEKAKASLEYMNYL